MLESEGIVKAVAMLESQGIVIGQFACRKACVEPDPGRQPVSGALGKARNCSRDVAAFLAFLCTLVSGRRLGYKPVILFADGVK